MRWFSGTFLKCYYTALPIPIPYAFNRQNSTILYLVGGGGGGGFKEISAGLYNIQYVT
jgi:hypothetical protein